MRHPRRSLVAFLWGLGVVAAGWAGCVDCRAQSTLEAPLGKRVAYKLDSGEVSNPGADWSTGYSRSIVIPGAHWVRLHFGTAELEQGSYLLVTSTLDGQTHRLDAAAMGDWNNSTAYLNGDTLDLQLFAAPNSRGNHITIEEIEAELGTQGDIAHTRGDSTQCGICTTDDRTLSMETWTGRIMPIGCTGSIICEDSTMISAGHCVGADQVLQFNVPPSTAACGTVNPPVDDQFPVTALNSVNGGVGNDWSVYRSGVNSIGQKPFDRYRQFRRLAITPAIIGDSTDIWGFGLNLTCSMSQAQQHSFGSITFRTNTYYSYNDDVRGGNSGSAFLKDGAVVGVVTHCASGCGGNIATRIDLPAFASAINAAMSCDDTFAVTFTGLGALPTISVSPSDTAGNSGGPVPFTRAYLYGTDVTATAPATISAECFRGWRVNNVDQGPNPTLYLTISGVATVQASYGPTCCPADRDDGSGLGFPDGAIEINDLLYYLNQFELGTFAADLDNGSGTGTPDHATDINDLIFFLSRFEAGC